MSIELTQAIAHELLDYFPHTGELRWRLREVKWFKNGKHSARHSCAMFNTQYAGKPAFNCTGPNGYLHGRIFNKAYYAHRIIFPWMIGRWPEPEVDHRNHHRRDNRWSNLRETTHEQNMRNQSLSETNISGTLGVYRYPSGRYWARINVNGRPLHLGCFASIEEAAVARAAANRKYGFSPGHGRVRLREPRSLQ